MPSQIRRKPAAQPEPTLKYGDHFGPYVITGFAGSGATSYVYRARRRDRFEAVAIKVLHPHLVADPSRRMTFYREARIMMRIQHPNVVRFEEIIDEGDTLAFVMEYVDGVTLSQWRESQEHGIDEMTLACVFVDVLRGVTAAHREGVIHRDLKPANILISEESGRAVAKIIDFGVARFVGQPLTERERKKIVGTAAYISPEEVGNPEEVSKASDLYSIGVMLYEAACGRRPFDGVDVRKLLESHVKENPDRPRHLNPSISSGMESVIMRTLEKNPGQRFRSAPEMIGAMEEALFSPIQEEEELALELLEATLEWSRATEVAESSQRRASLGRFFRRCLDAAMALVGTADAPVHRDGAHYLNRSGDAELPFR